MGESHEEMLRHYEPGIKAIEAKDVYYWSLVTLCSIDRGKGYHSWLGKFSSVIN
jgi:hypothetical protein